MQVRIEVLSVTINHVPNAKGGYDIAEIAYKEGGKVQGKKVVSFTNKEVFAAVSAMKGGESYDVVMAKEPGKDGKEYWQWKTITKATGSPTSPSSPASGYPSPKSTYETAEERAVKQKYIVRQSALNYAISVLKTDKNVPKYDEIAELAEKFVDFVYQEDVDVGVEGLNDDVPV